MGGVKGNREDGRRINAVLDHVRAKIRKIFHHLEKDGSIITPFIVREQFIGKKSSKRSLLQIFRQHNEEMRAQVGIP